MTNTKNAEVILQVLINYCVVCTQIKVCECVQNIKTSTNDIL